VFAVGQRVRVAACAEDPSNDVPLTDEAGKRRVASLDSGTEVAILAWRPGWSGTARYRVRATDSGDEGWLAVGNLDRTRSASGSDPASSPPVTTRALPDAALGRPFGKRN
jgi:hypothetical protein